jgi:putative transposase
VGDEVYHVINRANARLQLFFKDKDYQLVETILTEGVEKFDMRLLAYCIMPNHWHLVLHPRNDGDLQKFMQWVTLTHTQRWHATHRTIGTGHLYQGRYKSFLIEKDEHLKTVIRYVERNPLRAKLVKDINNWKYASLYQRLLKKPVVVLASWPTDMPRSYLTFVQAATTPAELNSLRYSVNRGKPYGDDRWTTRMIKAHDLATTITGRGRPRKGT